MGHAKPEDLTDLKPELDIIRTTLDGIKEKGLGVFYYKSTSFLHFHLKDGKRWADVKLIDRWQNLNIDFKPTISDKKNFLREVKKAHALFINKSKKK